MRSSNQKHILKFVMINLFLSQKHFEGACGTLLHDEIKSSIRLFSREYISIKTLNGKIACFDFSEKRM